MGPRAQLGIAAVVVLALLAAIAGPVPLLVFLIAVAVATGGELYRLARTRGIRPVALSGLASIGAMLFAVHVAEPWESGIALVAAAAIGLAFIGMLVRKQRTDVTRSIIYTLLPVAIVGLLAAYIVAIRRLEAGGFKLVLALGLIAIAADVAAAIVASRGPQPDARAWWRRLLGALAGASLGAIVTALALSPPITWPRAIVLAIVVAPAVTLTDAVAAMIEEDMGTARAVLFRRFDGVLLAAPVFFYAYRVF